MLMHMNTVYMISNTINTITTSNMHQSCDMLHIWFRHKRQRGPTELTEGTCVLSAFGSVSSVASTWFQLEAWYWFSLQVLRAFKLKHGQWDRKYVSWESENPISTPPPQRKGCVKKAKQLEGGGRKIDISDNLRNSETAIRLKELQPCALNIGSILQRKEMSKSRS